MRLAIILLATGLAVVVAIGAMLLLRSCGVRLPIVGTVISFCRDDASLAAEGRLAELEVGRLDLRRRIGFLERELGGQQCVAALPEPPDPEPAELPSPQPVTPLAPEITLPSQTNGLDGEAFNARDISLLEGCWDLDSAYRSRNIQSGAITNYDRWRMCFDSGGNGNQVLQGTDGTTCQGRVTGVFTEDGRLEIEDKAPVPCSSGVTIFRRAIACNLDEGGQAQCTSRQPEGPNPLAEFPVDFQRSQGTQ